MRTISQVRDQVRTDSSFQIYWQIKDQFEDLLLSQVWNQVGHQVWNQVADQVWGQIKSQIYENN